MTFTELIEHKSFTTATKDTASIKSVRNSIPRVHLLHLSWSPAKTVLLMGSLDTPSPRDPQTQNTSLQGAQL